MTPTLPDVSPLAKTYLRAQLGSEFATDAAIHPNDEMLCPAPLAAAMQDARTRAAAAQEQFEQRETELQSRVASLQEAYAKDTTRLQGTIRTMEASRFWKMRNAFRSAVAAATAFGRKAAALPPHS